jgi:hypothetical protein
MDGQSFLSRSLSLVIIIGCGDGVVDSEKKYTSTMRNRDNPVKIAGHFMPGYMAPFIAALIPSMMRLILFSCRYAREEKPCDDAVEVCHADC